MITNVEEINAVPIYAGIAPTNLDIAKGINSVFEEIALVYVQLSKRMENMAEQIDRLNAAVDQELADDSAQNQLIADLKAQLETAKAAVDGAVAGEEAAKTELQEALNAATDAAVRLESNDAPAEEEPPAEETPVEEPTA